MVDSIQIDHSDAKPMRSMRECWRPRVFFTGSRISKAIMMIMMLAMTKHVVAIRFATFRMSSLNHHFCQTTITPNRPWMKMTAPTAKKVLHT